MNPIKQLNRERIFTLGLMLFIGGFMIFISIVTIFGLGFHFGNILFFIVGIFFIIFSWAMNKHYDERKIAILNAIEAGMNKNIDRKEAEKWK